LSTPRPGASSDAENGIRGERKEFDKKKSVMPLVDGNRDRSESLTRC